MLKPKFSQKALKKISTNYFTFNQYKVSIMVMALKLVEILCPLISSPHLHHHNLLVQQRLIESKDRPYALIRLPTMSSPFLPPFSAHCWTIASMNKGEGEHSIQPSPPFIDNFSFIEVIVWIEEWGRVSNLMTGHLVLLTPLHQKIMKHKRG